MNEFLMAALEHAAAAASLLLMGACGVGLALRLLRVLRGQEAADGLTRRSAFAPGASIFSAILLIFPCSISTSRTPSSACAGSITRAPLSKMASKLASIIVTPLSL